MADNQLLAFQAPVVGLETDDHVLHERHGYDGSSSYLRGHKVVWIEDQPHSVPPSAGEHKSGFVVPGGGLHARDGIDVRCIPLEVDNMGFVRDGKTDLPALARRLHNSRLLEANARGVVYARPQVTKRDNHYWANTDTGNKYPLFLENNNLQASPKTVVYSETEGDAEPSHLSHARAVYEPPGIYTEQIYPLFLTNNQLEPPRFPEADSLSDGVSARSADGSGRPATKVYPMILVDGKLQPFPRREVGDLPQKGKRCGHLALGGGVRILEITPEGAARIPPRDPCSVLKMGGSHTLGKRQEDGNPGGFPNRPSRSAKGSSDIVLETRGKAGAENGIAEILADSLQHAAELVFPVVARDDGKLHLGGLRKRSGGGPETYRSVRVSESGKLQLGRLRVRDGSNGDSNILPGTGPGPTYGLVETDGSGRVHLGHIGKRSTENAGGSVCQITPGPAPGPVYCPAQAGGNGGAQLGRLSGRSDGNPGGKPEIKGGSFQTIPWLIPTINAQGSSAESGLNATEKFEANSTINHGDMARIFNSMSTDNLAVLLPVVMFGTLLLILVVFVMTFCCLRQAEETYNINIKGIENMKHRKRSAKQRRRNGASAGAAEEGEGWARPGMVPGQVHIDPAGNNRSWFLQRWYASLRGEHGPKAVSFAPSPEIVPQRSAMKSTMWSRHLDGGQDPRDPRDPSYVLEAVADRLQQQQSARGRPRSLSTIWSDGAPEELPGGKAVLATGRKGSDSVSQGTGRMSRRMHGAKVEASAAFHQDEGGSGQVSGEATTQTSTSKTTSGSDSTLTGSAGQDTDPSSIDWGTDLGVATELDTTGPSSSELLEEEALTLGTYRMMIEADLSIPDNLREPREFIRVMRPDLFQSSSETTLEYGGANQDSWVEDHGTVHKRHAGGKGKGKEEDEAEEPSNSGPTGEENAGDIGIATSGDVGEFLAATDGIGDFSGFF